MPCWSIPKLLILDEPSQGLAPLIVREVFRIVAQMRDEGISVLLVEQNARISLDIADYAYVLDNGAIVYEGPARELADDEARVQALAGASAQEWSMNEFDVGATSSRLIHYCILRVSRPSFGGGRKAVGGTPASANRLCGSPLRR